MFSRQNFCNLPKMKGLIIWVICAFMANIHAKELHSSKPAPLTGKMQNVVNESEYNAHQPLPLSSLAFLHDSKSDSCLGVLITLQCVLTYFDCISRKLVTSSKSSNRRKLTDFTNALLGVINGDERLCIRVDDVISDRHAKLAVALLEEEAKPSQYVSCMFISSTETADLHEALLTTVKFSLTRSQLFRHDYRVDEVNPKSINVSRENNVFYPNEQIKGSPLIYGRKLVGIATGDHGINQNEKHWIFYTNINYNQMKFIQRVILISDEFLPAIHDPIYRTGS